MLVHYYPTLCQSFSLCSVFFFNDPATTEIYTLSLHDALPIFAASRSARTRPRGRREGVHGRPRILFRQDRKSTRLNSSHVSISYAVFCLKKKNRWRTAPYFQCSSKYR